MLVSQRLFCEGSRVDEESAFEVLEPYAGKRFLEDRLVRFMRVLGATFQSDSVLESTWQLFAENNH